MVELAEITKNSASVKSLARPPPDPSGHPPPKTGEGKHIVTPDEASICNSPALEGRSKLRQHISGGGITINNQNLWGAVTHYPHPVRENLTDLPSRGKWEITALASCDAVL